MNSGVEQLSKHVGPETNQQVAVDFLDEHSIQALRDEQVVFAERNGVNFVGFGRPTPEDDNRFAILGLQNEVYNRAFVSQFVDPDNNPELYADAVNIVNKHSIFVMDDAKWNFGDIKADVNAYEPNTAGKFTLKQAQEQLAKSLTPESNGQLLSDELVIARAALAKLSIERRRKLSSKGKRNAQLEEAYETAADNYWYAQLAHAKHQFTSLQVEAGSTSELHQKAVTLAIEEHHAFAEEELKVLKNDRSLRGKVANFLAKSNRRFFATTAVAGGVTGFTTRRIIGAAGLAAGVGTGLGIGLAIGIGTTRAALNSLVGIRKNQITEHATRHQQDTDYLLTKADALLQSDDQQYSASSLDSFEATLLNTLSHVDEAMERRIQIDQRDNRIRLGKAALFGALGGTAGALLAGELSHFFGGNGTTPETTVKPTIPPETTSHAAQPLTPSHIIEHKLPSGNTGETNGFANNIHVGNGNGFTTELQEVAAQKNIGLNGAESYQLYAHLTDKFGGNLFTNNPSYSMGNGNYGISRPGMSHWNPAVLHEMNRWLIENDKLTSTS